jgi:uncharacterized protein (DUF2336 family)
MSSSQELLAELETALGPKPTPRSFEIMREVTDLFVEGADNYSVHQFAVFDDIICRLIDHNGPPAVIEVSQKLAPCGKGPVNVVRRLSSESDLAISGPFLKNCENVPEADLIQYVKTKRMEYLTLIATRPNLSSSVTDVLLERGDDEVRKIVLRNFGAKISDNGFVKLISEGRKKPAIAEMVAVREDLPEELRPFLKQIAPEKKTAVAGGRR